MMSGSTRLKAEP